jgi:hypothetical protein
VKYHKLQRANSIPSRRSASRNSRYRAWHRRLGLASCLFILLLSLTGILINHAHQIGLDKRGVQLDWLLDFYGIGQPNKINRFALLPSPLIGIDNQLWMEDTFILESSLPLLAALWYQQQIVAIDAKQLYIFDHLGQLLETQNSSSGLTPPLSGLFLTNGSELVLATQSGLLLADKYLLDWRSIDTTDLDKLAPALSIPQTIDLSPQHLTLSRSRHLSWERVVLDLHSGRLFGTWALWLWDLFAVALVVLTLSGLWMWRHKKSKR